MNRRFKKFIAFGIFAGILVAGFVVWRLSQFRLVGATPGTKGIVSTSTEVFRLTFNHELENKDYTEQLSGDSAELIRSIEVDKNLIYIHLAKTLSEDKSYSFEINNITSIKKELIDVVKFNFKAKYIPYNKLSKDQQNLNLMFTDRGNTEDPILSILPHDTLNYELDAVHSADDYGQYQFSIKLTIILSEADVRINRSAAISQYKAEAYDYIKKKGFKPGDYLIVTEVVEP